MTYLSLAETLSLVSASSVGNEGSVLSLDSDEVLNKINPTSKIPNNKIEDSN